MFSAAQWVILRQNGTVRRAAARDIEFKDRAARGSVWNELLASATDAMSPRRCDCERSEDCGEDE